MADYLTKATAFQGMVRAYAIQSTDTVEEARWRQDTWATATAALGRTISIAAIMGAMQKGDDTITLKIEGDGPLGAIIADSGARGNVRGYVINPHVDFNLNEQGKLDVARAVGTSGDVSVVKDTGLKDYFTGHVPIVSGEISEDMTYYFANSEQIPSSVGAGVLINPDHTVAAAGGFMVQVMPEADDDIIEQLEQRISDFVSVSYLIEAGYTPKEMLEKLLGQDDLKVHESMPVQFKCNCSKERLQRAIIGMGTEEIDAMIHEDHGAEGTCHFCNEVYHFTEAELEELKQSINPS